MCKTSDQFLPLPKDKTVTIGQKIIYGIRPEHLMPSIKGPGLLSKITVSEPTGADTHIYSVLANAEVCSISRERLDWQPGNEISLEPMLEHIHLFDLKSEQVIRRNTS
jgi:multiple sugar transport system ATP-binding protein